MRRGRTAVEAEHSTRTTRSARKKQREQTAAYECECGYERGSAEASRDMREEAVRSERMAYGGNGSGRRGKRGKEDRPQGRAQNRSGDARTGARSERGGAHRNPEISKKRKKRPKKGTTSFVGVRRPGKEEGGKRGALGTATASGGCKEKMNIGVYALGMPIRSTHNNTKDNRHRQSKPREMERETRNGGKCTISYNTQRTYLPKRPKVNQTRRWPTLGISKWEGPMKPAGFTAWLVNGTEADPRTAKSRAKAARLVAEWKIDVRAGEANAVMCVARAERMMKGWKAEKHGGKNLKRELPQSVTSRIVHTTVLPTAVASRAERFYLPGLKRHMSAEEELNAFGVAPRSTIRKAMQQAATDTQAIAYTSAAVEVRGLKMVVREAMKEAGMEVPEKGGSKLRMMSLCCGIGTMAEATEQLTQGAWEYVQAAEKGKIQRNILKAAWKKRGLTEARIADDAFDATMLATAPESDMLTVTMECGPFSRQSQTSAEEAMEEVDKVRKVMEYATRCKPAMIVFENAADLIKSARMRACGEAMEQHMKEALPEYTWRAQVIDAKAHAGVPMDRERAFWVGTRPPTGIAK